MPERLKSLPRIRNENTKPYGYWRDDDDNYDHYHYLEMNYLCTNGRRRRNS